MEMFQSWRSISFKMDIFKVFKINYHQMSKGQPSIFRFDHGNKMLWLLDSSYQNVWKDQDYCFCEKLSSTSSALERMASSSQDTKLTALGFYFKRFLKLTKNSLAKCPNQCQCSIARDNPLNFDQVIKKHLMKILNNLDTVDGGLLWSEPDRVSRQSSW